LGSVRIYVFEGNFVIFIFNETPRPPSLFNSKAKQSY